MSDDDNAAVGSGIPVSSDVDIEGFVFAPWVGYHLINNSQTDWSGLAS